MLRMVARGEAVKDLLTDWDLLQQVGSVPDSREVAAARPRSLYACAQRQLEELAAAPMSDVRDLLVGTGCGFNLVSKAEVAESGTTLNTLARLSSST